MSKAMMTKINPTSYANTSAIKFEEDQLGKKDIFDYFGCKNVQGQGLCSGGYADAFTWDNTIHLGELYFSSSKFDRLLTLLHEVFHLKSITPEEKTRLDHCDFLKMYYGPSFVCAPVVGTIDSNKWKAVMKTKCGVQGQ